MMIGTEHGAMGEMLRTAWRRGRRTGFLEGLIIGFLAAVIIVVVRMTG